MQQYEYLTSMVWLEAINPTFKAMPENERFYRYARDILKDRFPKAERVLVTDPKWAYFYARDVIKGRWPEAEPNIMRDVYWWQRYVSEVLTTEASGVFKVGDIPDKIKKQLTNITINGNVYSPWSAVRHAIDVIQGRFPEAEELILTDIPSAADYAVNVLKTRWPALEKKMFATTTDITGGERIGADLDDDDILAMAFYIHRILRIRLPKFEPLIMKNPLGATTYAQHVIKGRWKEAEPFIKQDQNVWPLYVTYVLKPFGISDIGDDQSTLVGDIDILMKIID